MKRFLLPILASAALLTGAFATDNYTDQTQLQSDVPGQPPRPIKKRSTNTSGVHVDHVMIDAGGSASLGGAAGLTDTQLRATAVNTAITNWPATQAVSLASAPLPIGAATAANQTTANTSLGTIATNTTGAATAANQTTANTSLASIDTKTPSKGQAAMSGSEPVTIASDQTAVPVSGTVTVPSAASYTTAVTTLQNAATATGNGTAMNVTGLSTVALQTSGTWNGVITVEGTVDGTNWRPITGTVVATNAFSAVAPVQTMGAGVSTTDIYRFPVSGLTSLRARISTYTSGSITVTGVGIADGAPGILPTIISTIGTAGSTDLASWAKPFASAGGSGSGVGNGFPALIYGMTGNSTTDITRLAAKFVPFTISASSAETTIWTPAASRKFRVLGYTLYSDTATTLTFRDNTAGTVIFRDGVGAGARANTGAMGNGVISGTNNNVLTVQCGTAATLSGTVWGTEE